MNHVSLYGWAGARRALAAVALVAVAAAGCASSGGSKETSTGATAQGGTVTPAKEPDRIVVQVVEVDHPDVHLKYAVVLCSPRIRAFQLVWTDDRGRWPTPLDRSR